MGGCITRNKGNNLILENNDMNKNEDRELFEQITMALKEITKSIEEMQAANTAHYAAIYSMLLKHPNLEAVKYDYLNKMNVLSAQEQTPHNLNVLKNLRVIHDLMAKELARRNSNRKNK